MQQPYLYTETAFHHEGDFDYMLALIDASASAGAQGVKFQVVIELDQLLSVKNPSFPTLKNYVFTSVQWTNIFTHAVSKGLDLIVMPLDVGSLDLAEGFRKSIKYLELHSVSYYDVELLSAMRKSGMNCMLGAGGRTFHELKQSKEYFGSALSTFMVGFQSFPSRIQDVRLNRITEIRNLFPDMQIGYADHSAFNDPWAVDSVGVAYGMGATIFEKHITLQEGKPRVDYESAVSPDKIGIIRQNLDTLYAATSADPFSMTEAETKYRNRQKVVVARHDLKQGERLGPENLRLKMTGAMGGIPEVSAVTGKILKTAVRQDEVINKEHVDG